MVDLFARRSTFGVRAADGITAFVGSWRFVLIHTVWFSAWILLHPEPFPFGLLTLLVSLEAIFLSTFVMMSQNRQAEKDHGQINHMEQLLETVQRLEQRELEKLGATV